MSGTTEDKFAVMEVAIGYSGAASRLSAEALSSFFADDAIMVLLRIWASAKAISAVLSRCAPDSLRYLSNSNFFSNCRASSP